MKNLNRLTGCALLLCLSALIATPAAAQNLFAPVARVNNAVVTEYEVQQRERFLQLLNAPGATRQGAIDALIDERLRAEAASDVGLNLTEADIATGISEFAGRANLTTEEFTAALNQGGVDYESFRDFVVTGIRWRELIRGLYGRQVSVSEIEIDRALGASTSGTGLRLLLSEIIIPAPPQNAAQVQALAERIAQSTSEAEFSGYASQYSATASRGRGGRLDWQNLSDLPPSLQPLLLALAPGEVTAPLPIPNAVALFQLRGIEETGRPTPEYSAIDYAMYYMAGGRSEATLAQAARLRQDVDRCDDLYATAKGQPPEVLERKTQKPGEIPQDIAIELSKLDRGEVSTTLTRSNGQTLVFLMMCGRTALQNEGTTREQAANQLRQQKLERYADQYLEQLRANARIVRQ